MQTRPRHSAERVDEIRDIAPLITCAALMSWHRAQTERRGSIARVQSGQGAWFTATLRRAQCMQDFAGVTFVPEGNAYPSVTVRGRSFSVRTAYDRQRGYEFVRDDQGRIRLFDLRWTDHPLVWREENPATLSLLPEGLKLNGLAEPAIASVVEHGVTVVRAEELLLGAVGLLRGQDTSSGPPHPAPVQ